jgi:hypothetical protein
MNYVLIFHIDDGKITEDWEVCLLRWPDIARGTPFERAKIANERQLRAIVDAGGTRAARRFPGKPT